MCFLAQCRRSALFLLWFGEELLRDQPVECAKFPRWRRSCTACTDCRPLMAGDSLLWRHQSQTEPVEWYRVRSIGFRGSAPVCPRYVRIALALTSLQGLTRVSPKCPACGVGHLVLAPGAWRQRERVSDRSSSSCQGLTRVITAGTTLVLVQDSPVIAVRGW